MAAPTLLRCCSKPPLSLNDEPSLDHGSPCPSMELCCEANMAMEGCWLKLGYRLGWLRKTSCILCSAHPPSLPCFGSNQACVHSSLLESRLPTAFMLVLLALQPRELFFLGPISGVLYMGLKPVTPQGWSLSM